MTFKSIPALFAAVLACAPLVVRAQDGAATPKAILDAMNGNLDNTSASKLAQRIRALAGKQDLAKGLRPAVQFVGDDAIIVFAIESPSGAPKVLFTTDGSVFDTQIAPTLVKLGDTNVYANAFTMARVGATPFAQGVGMDYSYNIGDNKISGSHFEAYPHNPDSDVDANAPKGKLTQMPNWKSQIFPNTDREWWVYVPAQYTADKPAAVMIFQDGGGYKDQVSRVFDRLIAKGDMPITVGVFIQPGNLPQGQTAPGGRGERSFEYDTRSDQYSRFLLEEILPEVEKTVKLKHDAASRAVAGLSSGASCAFISAWYRPDQFSKVLSWIGSFTDLSPGETGYEGAHNYPFLIRSLKDNDPRTKIRVFLQDGGNDLDNPYGDWPLANMSMARALGFKHMDYKFVFGGGNHSGTHGYAILPESLRWLWRDYPKQ